MFTWLKRRFQPHPLPLWYTNYIPFPTQTDTISIVMSSGTIIQLDNRMNYIRVLDDNGGYLLTTRFEVML